MSKITIRRDHDHGYTLYAFRPQRFIENFGTLTRSIPGIGYDRNSRRWTAPARATTIGQLQQLFGASCLVWEGGAPPDRVVDASGSSSEILTKQFLSEARPDHIRGGAKPVRFDPVSVRHLPVQWQSALHRTEEQLKVKRYSWRTVKSYLSHLRHFFAAHPNCHTADITNGVIRTYIVNRAEAGNYSESTQGQMLNAVKFWLEQVEGQERILVELRPKKEKKLPRVLSVGEVRRLFAVVDNLKHRCILKIIYGGGLRLGEVVNLRLEDIQSDRLQVFVHGGEGKKDRYTTLSQKFPEELREYFMEYRPDYWLFEGQTGGQYSTRSVQAVLKRAVKKSKVNAYCTVHTLRHNYATHLLESGVSLRHIQELLGHESSGTTEIYTHVSTAEKQKVISPLDRL